jgi:hypothetical protein
MDDREPQASSRKRMTGMRRAVLTRPAFYVPFGLLLVLGVTAAVVFHPAFQKRMLLEHVGPLVDSLEINRVHLTPWSLDLDDLDVVYRGGRLQVERATFSYCLSSLVALDLNLKKIALQGVSIDLEDFRALETTTVEPETQSPPFPGLLAVMDHGLGYTLQNVAIDGIVRLGGTRSLTATVKGGGIGPGKSGTIDVALRFDTGHQDDHIDVDGAITVRQRSRGLFDAIETSLGIEVALAALPETERLKLMAAARPSQAVTGGDQDVPPSPSAGEAPRYRPEELSVAAHVTDVEGNNRSVLDLEGIYNGNSGVFEGDYRLTANEHLVKPYLRDRLIPPAEQALGGDILFDVADLTGHVTVTSDLEVKDLREVSANDSLPELLRLRNDFRLSLRPGWHLRVEKLDTGLFDEDENSPLTSSLADDLTIPLEDIDAFLHQDNTLLEFELPGIPLAWFDVFLPEHEIRDGILSGAFTIATDTNSAIHLNPVRPLEISGLVVGQKDALLVDGVNLSVLPRMTYSADAIRLALDDLVIDGGRGALATAELEVTVPLSDGDRGLVSAQGGADLDTHFFLDLLGVAKTDTRDIPARLSLEYQTTLLQQKGVLTVKQMDARLSREDQGSLLHLQLLQPLSAEDSETGWRTRNVAGPLARLDISDIPLEWLSAFMPDTTLRGTLSRAAFTLSTPAAGVASIDSDGEFAIGNLSLAGPEGRMLDNISIRLKPTIRYSTEGTQIAYRDLGISSRKRRLVSGNGSLTLPGTADKPAVADGQLDIDMQAVSRQPLVAAALQAEIEAPLRLEADYSLARDDSGIDVSRLALDLYYADPEPRLSLRSDSKLHVRTQIGRRETRFGHAAGRVTLAVARLTPEPFAAILDARGLSFAEASGKAVLTSDGRSLTVDTVEPMVIKGIDVRTDEGALLHPFTVTAESVTTLEGDTLHASLDRLGVSFDGRAGGNTLDARLDLTLRGSGDEVTLDSLNADLKAFVPALLDQPAMLPGHTLKAGDLASKVTITHDGRIVSETHIQGLQGKKELALRTLEMEVDGRLIPGGGFDIVAPVRGTGRSGDTDILLKARYLPKDNAGKVVDIAVDSSVFYLNDILNSVNSIKGKRPAGKAVRKTRASEEGATDGAAQRTAGGKEPDERAFWDKSAYDARVVLKMDRLFYTDYLEIHDISGSADLFPDRLAFSEFAAHFYESLLTMDGVMRFAPGDTPYDLKLDAGVQQFDLARFFRELAPGSTPRTEGLFDVSLEAYGKSPNLPQYRNNLYFDMRLHSREGVFRPFNPDSALVASSSGFAGVVGEGVSYVPTGLFGLGAVSRLVNYIKEIDYDRIDIRLVRDDSRDVKVRQSLVQSPDILMSAEGGIEYREGIDILDSPLSLQAQLDMRERGAAILYSLDLLESERDQYGYWKGPTFKAWGTLARSQTNLEEIIAEAGQGAVLGGITRPISGLIGNIRHIWRNDAPEETIDTPEDTTESGE